MLASMEGLPDDAKPRGRQWLYIERCVNVCVLMFLYFVYNFETIVYITLCLLPCPDVLLFTEYMFLSQSVIIVIVALVVLILFYSYDPNCSVLLCSITLISRMVIFCSIDF